MQSPSVSPSPLLQNLPLLCVQLLAAQALQWAAPLRTPRLGTMVRGSCPPGHAPSPKASLCRLHALSTWRPLTWESTLLLLAPGLAQDLLSVFSARTTMVQQHAVPVGAEQGSPHSLLERWMEGCNTYQQGSWQAQEGRGSPSPRTGHPGELRNLNSSPPRWGTGKIRGRRKATGSCAFLWCQGRLVFELSKRKPGSVSSSVFAPSCARSVPSIPSAGPASGDALSSLVASTSGAPGREMRGVDPTLNWQKPGMKTQPIGIKSREISLGRFFSLKSPLAPSREVQRTRLSLCRGQGAQPKLFIHCLAPRREEQSDGMPGEIRHGCCSCACREPRPPLRARRCI